MIWPIFPPSGGEQSHSSHRSHSMAFPVSWTLSAMEAQHPESRASSGSCWWSWQPDPQARSWGSAFTEGRKILLVLCLTPRPPLRHPQGKALPGSRTSPFQCARLSERAPLCPPPHVLRLTLPAGVTPQQAPQSGRLEPQPPSTQSPLGSPNPDALEAALGGTASLPSSPRPGGAESKQPAPPTDTVCAGY